MRLINLILILLLCSTLVACCCSNTPNVARVCYYGNFHTSRPATENDILYRCAQITLERGFNYFVIGPTNTSPSYHPTLVECNDWALGRDCRGRFLPPSYRLPPRIEVSSVTIKMYRCYNWWPHWWFSEELPPNTYNACEICNFKKFNGEWCPLR